MTSPSDKSLMWSLLFTGWKHHAVSTALWKCHLDTHRKVRWCYRQKHKTRKEFWLIRRRRRDHGGGKTQDFIGPNRWQQMSYRLKSFVCEHLPCIHLPRLLLSSWAACPSCHGVNIVSHVVETVSKLCNLNNTNNIMNFTWDHPRANVAFRHGFLRQYKKCQQYCEACKTGLWYI